MRKILIPLALVVSASAFGSIRDHRENVKLSPELSQSEVGKQQSRQSQIGVMGGVPERTDEVGPPSQSLADPSAADVLTRSARDSAAAEAPAAVLKTNAEAMGAEAAKPRSYAFGLAWAIILGAVLAFAAWVGLQKFGSTPPHAN